MNMSKAFLDEKTEKITETLGDESGNREIFSGPGVLFSYELRLKP